MIAIDTSALIAIANAEADAKSMLDIIGTTPARFVSTATLLEAHSVARRWSDGTDPDILHRLISGLELTKVAFDDVQLEAAKLGYATYGRGTGHPAGLNMGDCFAYALAKTRNLPLLFKGNDFIHTDIVPALKIG